MRHLLLIALAALLVSAVAGYTLLTRGSFLRQAATASADRARPEGARGRAWRGALRTGRTVGLFGLIALCAAYDEGAIGDWGALHLRQDLGADAGLAAAGYAAFALAEASGRLSGTALLERLGRTKVLVLGGLTACAGMLVASLAPDVWLALAGFAATGLGLANLFPAAIARAGLLAGSSGVALTSTLGYSGFLLGPPAIGFLASEFGLRAGADHAVLPSPGRRRDRLPIPRRRRPLNTVIHRSWAVTSLIAAVPAHDDADVGLATSRSGSAADRWGLRGCEGRERRPGLGRRG